MFWTVKFAARYLGMEPHQVYYLLAMGEIESVKICSTWRIVPETVKDYDRRFPERKTRKPAGNFIYSGSGGFLFSLLPDSLPADPLRKTAGMERRRGSVVYSAKRSPAVLLQKFKSVIQLDLFAS